MAVPTSAPSSVQAARDLVAAFTRLRRRLRSVAGTDELTPSQTSVLGLLARGGAATASALAATEGVRPQSMASTLSALEQRGLVRRRADPSDGRRQIVALTAEGDAYVSGSRAARYDWLVRTIDAHLTEDERRTLVAAAELMQRLTDA